jgi:uncharacterized MAPEG superfamily protein
VEIFAAYSHAIASLGLWSILICLLAAYSTVGRAPDNRCDCGKPKRNYSDPVYRRERAFMNAVEGAGPFIAATLAAILIGASPFVVNLLASVFLVARIAMAGVHIWSENQMFRSLFFMIGLLCILGLAIVAVIAAL